MHLSGLMNPDDLETAIAGGAVMVSEHPDFGYKIYHYTRKCMYDRLWNPTILQCRGLIIAADGTVIARPLQKFWTYGQARLPKTVDKPCIVTEKLDGSCGVLYPTPSGEYQLSTTKKFSSAQALWATNWWRENCPDIIPPPNCTPLFEMIYPQHRIVIDYGERSELTLFAIIDNETGADLDLRDPMVTAWWPGNVVKIHWDVKTLDEAYHLASSHEYDGSEGLVLCWLQHNAPSYRLKVKNPEYLRMHRVITNVSSVNLWEALAEGHDFEDLLERVPDEFDEWVRNTVAGLQVAHDAIISDTARAYRRIVRSPGDEISRRAFAKAAKEQTDVPSGLLFYLHDEDLDGLSGMAWKMVKPNFSRPFRTDEEA